MDTLKSLMDKHEFELVLKLTEKSEDIDSIFYRISAFVGLGKPTDALMCLQNNRETLQKNLYLLIKINIELLLILGAYDDAYEMLDYYQNLPYESQQVEELLKELPKRIREAEKNQYKDNELKDDDIKARLRANDKVTVMSAIDALSRKDVVPFISDIQYTLLNNQYQSMRSLALMLLVKAKVEKEVSIINKRGDILKVIPSQIKPPFTDDTFNNLVKRIRTEFKNPSISDNAISILSTYIIDIYPEQLTESEDDIVAAIYLLASNVLQVKDVPSIEEFCSSHNLNVEEVSELYQKLSESVKM